MDLLAVFLALNGAVVLAVGLLAGLALYWTIRRQEREAAWHLLHAGGSTRGVMLLAVAATIRLAALPPSLAWTSALLIVVFAWASTIAMLLGAITGERGFEWSGSPTGRLAFALYVIGVITVLPGFALLVIGLFCSL
jgi:hypothetical protein